MPKDQRRYVESLSAYARHVEFLSLMEKPDVDHIEGLVAGDFHRAEIHLAQSPLHGRHHHRDLRLSALLYARAGIPRCPDHGIDLDAQTVGQMVDQVLALPEGSRLMLLAPVVKERKGEHVKLLQELQAQGFVRARIDGEVVELDSPPPLDLRRKHTIEVVVDRFKVRDDLGLAAGGIVRDRVEAGQRHCAGGLSGRAGTGGVAVFRRLRLSRSAVTA
jgi:excinuclease ABC subunit A